MLQMMAFRIFIFLELWRWWYFHAALDNFYHTTFFEHIPDLQIQHIAYIEVIKLIFGCISCRSSKMYDGEL